MVVNLFLRVKLIKNLKSFPTIFSWINSLQIIVCNSTCLLHSDLQVFPHYFKDFYVGRNLDFLSLLDLPDISLITLEILKIMVIFVWGMGILWGEI